MKKLKYFILFVAVTAAVTQAQSKFFFGAAPLYEQPLGGLNNRFKADIGATIFAGAKTSGDVSWLGSISFANFSKPNYDKLVKQVEVQSGLDKLIYQFPLSNLTMKLKTATLMAEANYEFFRNNLISTNLNVGFGFTNWTYSRERFADSLFAVIPGSTNPSKISKLDVPGNSQTDWSGTLKIGLNASITIAEPVEIFALVNYKIIIGELWPALALDIENVSGMQFLQIGLGVKTTF